MHGFITDPVSPSLPTPTQTYIIQHVRDHLELAPEIAQDLMTFQICCRAQLFDKGLGKVVGVLFLKGVSRLFYSFD